MEVASLLVPENSDLVSAQGRGFPAVKYMSDSGAPLRDVKAVPLVVLVNEDTGIREIIKGEKRCCCAFKCTHHDYCHLTAQLMLDCFVARVRLRLLNVDVFVCFGSNILSPSFSCFFPHQPRPLRL